ncbi:MAG TPA: hypothetical protein VFF33_01685 [Ignavibacteriaceae bacterium]|nr:hypothetical protein [Ignavibacteriaceae bacterium]
MNLYFRCSILLLSFISAFIIVSCSDNQKYYDVVNKNITAMETEDINLLVSTLDVHNPQYSSAKLLYTKSFEEFDYDYTIEEINVIEEKADLVKLEAIMSTKRIRKNDIRTNKYKVDYTLVGNSDVWKILKTEIKADI